MKKIKYAIITIVITLSFGFGKPSVNIDFLVLKALYYGEDNPKEASKVWRELFELTGNKEYIEEYFYTSLEYKKTKDIIKELKSVLNTKKSNKLLFNLYLKEGDTNSAIETSSALLDGNIEYV